MKKKVLAIMLVTMSIMLISACGKKEKLYEIPDLSQYKTDYVGDSSKVINIVSGQEYPEGYSYDSIEIQSETEPYGLTVFLKDESSAAKLEDELQVNADMTFDLIGNLGTIDYKTADSKEIIASYER
jgi:predicted small lipoprotein YifL